MKKSVLGKLAFAGLAATGCVVLWGCPNPNDIGVQNYGTVQATCLQASNNQPVAGALATISGQTGPPTNSSGQTTISKVPIGTNVGITCDAPGLHGSATVPSVKQDITSTVTILLSPS